MALQKSVKSRISKATLDLPDRPASLTFNRTPGPLQDDRCRVIWLLALGFGVHAHKIEFLPHGLPTQGYSRGAGEMLDTLVRLTSISSSMFIHSRAEMGTELGILYKRSEDGMLSVSDVSRVNSG